jgi:DNA-binding transcriptional LysR family regulator
MQLKNWNDLRYLLAVEHGKTLNAAARRLGVDATTVSRRLTALQSQLGVRLVERRGDGKLVLTEAGQTVARQAEAMEQHFRSIGPSIGNHDNTCVGTVRVTSVPILANRLIASAAKGVLERHSGLTIELVPDSRDYNLTLREADVARPAGRATEPRLAGSRGCRPTAFSARATSTWVNLAAQLGHASAFGPFRERPAEDSRAFQYELVESQPSTSPRARSP